MRRLLEAVGDVLSLACASLAVAAAWDSSLWPISAFSGLGAVLLLRFASRLRR